MSKYGSLVVDESQFEYFVNEVLPPLKEGECYFISLSARNKYLTEEERETYQLGRTEMFARTLCYGDWSYAMKKLASHLTYKTTKSGLPFPEKSLVVYVNINPSNVVLASMRFAKTVNAITEEMVRSYMQGAGNPNLKSLDKAERLLLNEIQKTTGEKTWFDIDVDSKEPQDVELVTAMLDAYGVHYVQVNTVGGSHVLVNRKSLKESKLKNLHEQVNKINQKLKGLGGECVFNGNAMVPLAGTLQSGTLVTVKKAKKKVLKARVKKLGTRNFGELLVDVNKVYDVVVVNNQGAYGRLFEITLETGTKGLGLENYCSLLGDGEWELFEVEEENDQD